MNIEPKSPGPKTMLAAARRVETPDHEQWMLVGLLLSAVIYVCWSGLHSRDLFHRSGSVMAIAAVIVEYRLAPGKMRLNTGDTGARVRGLQKLILWCAHTLVIAGIMIWAYGDFLTSAAHPEARASRSVTAPISPLPTGFLRSAGAQVASLRELLLPLANDEHDMDFEELGLRSLANWRSIGRAIAVQALRELELNPGSDVIVHPRRKESMT